MKTQILTILRLKKEPVSGQIISSKLNISRVSVWKHIQKLQQLGYEIKSSSIGYQLVNSPDTPFPWEFGELQKKIHYFPEITSTMDIAKKMAQKGCPDFSVIIAGKQKQGRGRLKRVWLSSEGGLYFTIVLRPQIPPVLSYRVNFAASLVLARTLCNMFKINAKVKWPNDILVQGKKLCGILSEMEAEADIVSFINIGIGINVNNTPLSEEIEAVSIKEIIGKKVSRKQLLATFLNRLESFINTNRLENVISEWKKYSITLNKHVRIVTNKETNQGIAIDVDENGALILELADGSIKKIIHGDCFHNSDN